MPEIGIPVEIKNIVQDFDKYGMIIAAYEEEKETTLKSVLRKAGSGIKAIALVIGPEGGFTQDEVELLRSSRAVSVTMGPRILRTETAGIVLLSILMYELGDM